MYGHICTCMYVIHTYIRMYVGMYVGACMVYCCVSYIHVHVYIFVSAVKRDLLQCQKRPTTVHVCMYTRMQVSKYQNTRV
jgi:hypothetical protein